MTLYMISNQLHINLSKCTYIHFKPNINIKKKPKKKLKKKLKTYLFKKHELELIFDSQRSMILRS